MVTNRKMPEKASRTAAAPKAPAPIPAFFADLPTSALASSISLRISVETSAMALCTRAPTEGSSARVVLRAPDGFDGALWATRGTSWGRRTEPGRPTRADPPGEIVPHDHRARAPWPPALVHGRPGDVLERPRPGSRPELAKGGGTGSFLSPPRRTPAACP